ncbi:aromatic amino acid ammonia-lyase [Bacteriovorax sp. PP10]|uniref:Aromatic amino acid ammonia-lyase n=1 Tax=Bacteriovorax antarcticus TaxID=3088717 RepID=A0ABU5VXV4_9BACT|nr:aromatic amino acid ammonia-lyase [Bacteriovorax sp. PP10]MEA9357188.1 aromatic amino acid ammonia-lyase [Bacteriovorax sp. PP10]
MKYVIGAKHISFADVLKMHHEEEIDFDQELIERVNKSHENFKRHFAKEIPIYGVTTGFGDSCHRSVRNEDSEILQDNLVSYLMMGTGKNLSKDVGASMLLFRIISLSRGYSGVSIELLNKMKELYNKKIFPVIPREGSLGASGDLIPLAYIANNVRGQGRVYYKNEECDLETLVASGVYTPHKLLPKEGLAMVNGTTSMTALSFHNFQLGTYLNELAMLCSGWLCLTIHGRVEAFGTLVNNEAKKFAGQSFAAEKITEILTKENYTGVSYHAINKNAEDGLTTHLVQDPYSLRCAPQVLGPVSDTLSMIEQWIEMEINGVSDNPLFDQEDRLANGGNFYGGYLAHSMDYLKICMGNIADLMDRQLTLLISEKTNRGLTPNLANWEGIDIEKRHLSHGLKGVHQNVSAITSDIMAKCIPNTIFSRSSESHNQDKVSLGMTAAVQSSEQLEVLVTVFACYLCCLAQAVDLRKIKLQGEVSKRYYDLVRSQIPFVEKDMRLDIGIMKLRDRLLVEAKERGHVFV